LDSLSVMDGQSYSAWFLRFLAAFNGPRGRDTPGASHEAWLAAFAESFRGARSTDEAAEQWLALDLGDEEHGRTGERDSESHAQAEPPRQQQARQPEQKRRFMQSGGEDVEG
jgi:hypothetical protein